MKPLHLLLLHAAISATLTPVLFAAPAATNIAIPAAAEIIAKLRPGHPRLLAGPPEFRDLKTRVATDAQLKPWHASLRKSAERILAAPPSRYEIPDGLRLLSTSRRVVERMQTLGLA